MRRVEVWEMAGGVVLCPRCLSAQVKKGGLLLGRQRCECHCGRVFVAKAPGDLIADRVKLEIRQVAAGLVESGVTSVQAAAKAVGVSARTIYYDMKRAKAAGDAGMFSGGAVVKGGGAD